MRWICVQEVRDDAIGQRSTHLAGVSCRCTSFEGACVSGPPDDASARRVAEPGHWSQILSLVRERWPGSFARVVERMPSVEQASWLACRSPIRELCEGDSGPASSGDEASCRPAVVFLPNAGGLGGVVEGMNSAEVL
jgi:hypothetical protein